MKLTVKQKAFSVGDSYKVLDEKGKEKYTVKQKLGILHNLYVYDSSKQEIGGLEEDPQILGRNKYDLFVRGESVGQIKPTLDGFKDKYILDGVGWHTKGNLVGKKFEVLDGDRVVGRVSKKLFALKDTYDIEYERPDDELMLLMLVIGVDAINRPEDED